MIEMDKYVDSCVVDPNALVVHNHGYYLEVYGFDEATRHKHVSNFDDAIITRTHSLTWPWYSSFNQVFKIDSMINMHVCPIQCFVNCTMVNECIKFHSPCLTEEDHALHVNDPSTAHLSPFHCPLIELSVTWSKNLWYWWANPPWDPSTFLFSSAVDSMVDCRGRMKVECATDPCGPDMTISYIFAFIV